MKKSTRTFKNYRVIPFALITLFTISACGGGGGGDANNVIEDVITESADASIFLNEITDDNIISFDESEQNINVSGGIGGDLTNGDEVILTIGNVEYTATVDQLGEFSTQVSGADLVVDDDNTIEAKATTTTGNPVGEATAETSITYEVDTHVPFIEVILSSVVTHDDVIDIEDFANGANQIEITGTVSGDIADGSVELEVNNNKYGQSLTDETTFMIFVPVEDLVNDEDLTIVATATTSTFNVGVNGYATATDSDSYTVDITPTTATIKIEENITEDNYLSDAELNAGVSINGTVGGDVKDSDIISIEIGDSTFSGTSVDGEFSIEVTGTSLRNDTDRTIIASVTSNDANGSATVEDTKSYTGDIPPNQMSFSIFSQYHKNFTFQWSDEPTTTSYRLYENASGDDQFVALGDDIDPGVEEFRIDVALIERLRASYILEACNEWGCRKSEPLVVTSQDIQAASMLLDFDDEGAYMGNAVSLTSDGKQVAVGAPLEDETGAVTVYTQDGIISTGFGFAAEQSESGDYFGYSVSISADGTTIAASAPREASDATGINGDESNNNAEISGAVYIYGSENCGTVFGFEIEWCQKAFLKRSADSTAIFAFGSTVDISDDGNTVAVASEDSPEVHIFTRDGNSWSLQQLIVRENIDASGVTIALSGSGDSLAIGFPGEDSNSQGIDGDEMNTDAENSGAVYVYSRAGETWSQDAYLKAANSLEEISFGSTLDISFDGNVIAVGARRESGKSIGINGDEYDVEDGFGTSWRSGAAYLFEKNGTSWNQQAYFKDFSDVDSRVQMSFGSTVSLTSDGTTLAVSSAEAGNDDSVFPKAIGAVYVFREINSVWRDEMKLRPDTLETDEQDHSFGATLSLSSDGTTLAVGDPSDDTVTVY